MKQPTDTQIALFAVGLLVFSAAAVWDIGANREQLAIESQRAQAIDYQVETRQATGDYDGDGITDNADVCPTRPETTNGFQDDDGCPDIVATTGAS